MGAAMLKRENMVDFLRWRVSASREAVLAERVGGDVCGADFAPPGTVPAVHFRVTLEAPVALVLSFGVLLAEAGGGELGASGLGTRTRRLRRHPSRSLSAHGEALGNRASGSRGLFRANARIVCFFAGRVGFSVGPGIEMGLLCHGVARGIPSPAPFSFS